MRAASTLVLAAALAAAPASASFQDDFLAVVRKVHPHPDQVEMARYWIAAPQHATPVYTRAMAQDYGFVALLTAAKAARGRRVPGTTVTFDEKTCLVPVHAFDAVFSKVDEVMRDHVDDPRVLAVTDAGTRSAKEQAAAQLGQVVPYWSDIPHICHFTFHTNLEVEEDFASHLERAKKLKEALAAFATGDVVTGASRLVAAGLDESSACLIADQLLAGGFVSKTPVVNTLAAGLCSGFAGEILNLAGDALDAGIDAASNIGDGIAGQTKHAPPDEYYRTHWLARLDEGVAHSRAGSWSAFLKTIWEPCADYFDTHTMSRDNAQLTCDRHRDAFTRAVQQRQEEQDAAAMSAIEGRVKQKVAEWGADFQKTTLGACLDDPCRDEIRRLRAEAVARGNEMWHDIAIRSFDYMEQQLQPFADRGRQVVEASKKRFHAEQIRQTDAALGTWAQQLVATYGPRCRTARCTRNVENMGEQYVARGKALQRERTQDTSHAVRTAVTAEFQPRFQQIVDESVRDAGHFDDPDPRRRLGAMGCRLFLGREDNWLCYDDIGYDQCVAYVNSRQARECRYPPAKKQYGPLPDGVPHRDPGGRPGPIQLPPRRETTPSPRPSVAPPPIRELDVRDTLERRGCRFFLGRADDWLCTTDAGYNACARFKAQGKAKECRRAGR